jgi:hypothetical protein
MNLAKTFFSMVPPNKIASTTRTFQICHDAASWVEPILAGECSDRKVKMLRGFAPLLS